MARIKKTENETPSEATIRRTKEYISNSATRSEKVSWDRKMDNMVALLTDLQPIEDQIIDLMARKIPIFDNIQVLRNEMVNSCVHPFTHLVVHDDFIMCKFCGRKFRLVDKNNGI